VIVPPARAPRRWLVLCRHAVLLAGIAALLTWAWQARPPRLADGALGWLVLGACLSQLAVCAFALRFREVMRIVGLELGVLPAWRITTLAMFCHFFVPLGAGADLTKFAKLRAAAPARRKRAMAGGIALEHAIGLASLLLTAGVLLVVLEPLAPAFTPGPEIALAAVPVAALAWGLLRRRLAGDEVARWLRQIAQQRAALGRAVALSLLTQCLLAAAVYAASTGLVPGVSYADVLFVLAASFVLQALPAQVAGIGAADVAGTGLYVALGLPLPVALLLVSLLYGFRLLAALTGGLAELLAAPAPHPLPAAVDG
jgi:uncharacterized membrane protein YbhN (UPF0104 family)